MSREPLSLTRYRPRRPWSRRSRRLLLVLLLFPGVALAITGTLILAWPAMVVAGVAWLATDAVIWRAMQARSRRSALPATLSPSEETVP